MPEGVGYDRDYFDKVMGSAPYEQLAALPHDLRRSALIARLRSNVNPLKFITSLGKGSPAGFGLQAAAKLFATQAGGKRKLSKDEQDVLKELARRAAVNIAGTVGREVHVVGTNADRFAERQEEARSLGVNLDDRTRLQRMKDRIVPGSVSSQSAVRPKLEQLIAEKLKRDAG